MRHVATVYGVYVSPDMRGRGIASDLMHTLLDELQSMPQIEKVSLTVNSESAAATGLYQRLGFATVGRAKRDLHIDGRYYDLHYMERFVMPR